MLYTAKGAGALFVALFTGIAKEHGWNSIFVIFMSFNIIAGVMALFVLKPMRSRHFARLRELGEQ